MNYSGNQDERHMLQLVLVLFALLCSSVTANEDCKQVIIIDPVESTSTSVTISWMLLNSTLCSETFTIKVETVAVRYQIPAGCPTEGPKKMYIVQGDSLKIEDLLPYSIVQITITTNCTNCNATGQLREVTLATGPDAVQEFAYALSQPRDAEVIISWKSPCRSNGILSSFTLTVNAFGNGQDPINNRYIISAYANVSAQYTFTLSNLLPNYYYSVHIEGYNQGISSSGKLESLRFKSYDGLPPPVSYKNLRDLNLQPVKTTQEIVKIPTQLFSDTNGQIIYYAIILGEVNEEPPSPPIAWLETNQWPNISTWKQAGKGKRYYQATPLKWNPFTGGNPIFIVGSDSNCANLNAMIFCNGPLNPSTTYGLIIRGFTSSGYRDTPRISFTTIGDNTRIYIIAFTVSGVAVIVVLAGLGFIYVKKKRQGLWMAAMDPVGLVQTDLLAHEPIPEGVKDDFARLVCQTKASLQTKNLAKKEENKSKNRYENVVPYDKNAVSVKGNYVNGSIIQVKGVQYKYITTQGPLVNTCDDFWSMIYEFKSKIIVMLCKFIENGKDKCFKYFPDEGKELNWGNYSVQCILCKNNDYYIERQFILTKVGETNNSVITHLQFTDWPDFGVPESVKTLINFCAIVQSRVNVARPVVIHCSAGIGRTGTFIALDLILRGKATDIFSLIVELRHQREGMVQTLDQYYLLCKCLRLMNSKSGKY